MIIFWRLLCIFAALNLINLWLYDGGAGMEPIWMVLLSGSLVLSFSKPYHFFFSYLWFKIIILASLAVFITVETFIVLHGLQIAPNGSNYIIVLGARVKGETPSLALQHRLDKAYTYLIDNPDTQAVLSGGQGSGENITEAEAMRRYLSNKGISEDRLILESLSTNTFENLTNSFALIDEQMPHADVVVVTSRFHILRSKMIAHKLGKKVQGIGSETLIFLIPNYYLREFFAVIKECLF